MHGKFQLIQVLKYTYYYLKQLVRLFVVNVWLHTNSQGSIWRKNFFSNEVFPLMFKNVHMKDNVFPVSKDLCTEAQILPPFSNRTQKASSSQRLQNFRWGSWQLPFTLGTVGSIRGVLNTHRSQVQYQWHKMRSQTGEYGTDHFLQLTPILRSVQEKNGCGPFILFTILQLF